MKVYFDDAFYPVYTADPAAAAGRMEAMVAALADPHTFEPITPAEEIDLLRAHSPRHLAYVRDRGLYDIAALAAGGAIQAARAGLAAPAFALVRPPRPPRLGGQCLGFLLCQQHGRGANLPQGRRPHRAGPGAGLRSALR